MLKKIITAIILSLTWLISSFAFPDKNFEFSWQQGYRYDLRRDNRQLYINRLSSVFSLKNKQDEALFKLEPLFEFRRNIDTNIWERKELGVEIGKNIFPWLYLGEGIQAVWLREDYRQYTTHKRRDALESETRLLFTQRIFSNKHIELSGFILDEYTYDFDIGAGVRNEVAFGLIIPLNKYLKTNINWRHIDLIHDFDSDALEASITLVF